MSHLGGILPDCLILSVLATLGQYIHIFGQRGPISDTVPPCGKRFQWWGDLEQTGRCSAPFLFPSTQKGDSLLMFSETV